MTDKEIKKALECCKNGNPCSSCPYNGKCTDEDFSDNYLIKDVIALITRQQTEIERLETELKAMRGAANTYRKWYNEAKSEAIKEFKQRLKNFKIKPDYPWDDYFVTESAIDNVAKELMKGGANNDR